jgi:hypothetical protein
VILLTLWRRGLLGRIDREKFCYFLGHDGDAFALSRQYPMWRILGVVRLLVDPRYARAVGRWLEYRMNLFDGAEG